MEYGLARLASAIPRLALADCEKNLDTIARLVDQANDAHVDILVLPELSLTGFTCADLFLQTTLLERAEHALRELIAHTRKLRPLVVVGLPVKVGTRLYNCAALVSNGKLLGVVPKSQHASHGEYADSRWFSDPSACNLQEVILAGETVPFGADLLFQCANYPALTAQVVIGGSSCVPMSSEATVLLQLAADTEQIGNAALRRRTLAAQANRDHCAIVYAGAGFGESSTDAVFAGHGLIAENGAILRETERFSADSQLSFCDIDLELLEKERLHNPCVNCCLQERRIISFELPKVARPLVRTVSITPFLPDSAHNAHLEEIFTIQIAALRRRFEATNSKTAILGISGGLDSALALLVTVGTFDCMGRDRSDIIGITMPGFGTTDKTYQNALRLMQSLGITWHEIPIHKSVSQHFTDIEHDPNIHDTTYENAQARERTQILMDLANKENGLVIGTGNLSELALGFTTYGADHLSMYAINSGVPKTLVRLMVELLANSGPYPESASRILRDIAETPISPELLPPDSSGKIKQRTEELIGPYALHDFFLYYIIHYGFAPRKIVYLAESAFAGKYERPVIIKWLRLFYHRFFSQQFKRSCMPDGPKVGPISLSPRGSWLMPSDASGEAWLREVANLE